MSRDRTVRSQILGSNFDLSKLFFDFFDQDTNKNVSITQCFGSEIFFGFFWAINEEHMKSGSWLNGKGEGGQDRKHTKTLGLPKPIFWP